MADFFKGLIKLGAAGVKVRQGLPNAVASLARGAAQHFRDVALQLERDDLGGLSLKDLAEWGDSIAARAGELHGDPSLHVEVVFARRLEARRSG